MNFKLSDHAGDLFESSDDLEGMAGVNAEEESDVSVDSDASKDDDDCTVMGEHELFIYIVAV